MSTDGHEAHWTLEALAIEAPKRVEAALRAIADQRAAGAALEANAALGLDAPFNAALGVDAVAFRPWRGALIGALATPWTIALAILPGPDDALAERAVGACEAFDFPSGRFVFTLTELAGVGPFWICRLPAEMGRYANQFDAADTAATTVRLLFIDDAAAAGEGDRRAPRGEARRSQPRAATQPAAAARSA